MEGEPDSGVVSPSDTVEMGADFPAPLTSQTENFDCVFPQELRPDFVLEGHILHVAEDAIKAQSHGEIAGIDDLVGPTGVRIIDDRLG